MGSNWLLPLLCKSLSYKWMVLYFLRIMVIIQIRWFKSVWKDKGRYREEGRSQEALMLVPVHTDRYRESSKLLKQDFTKSFPNAVISF